jgi:hypothetical protein
LGGDVAAGLTTVLSVEGVRQLRVLVDNVKPARRLHLRPQSAYRHADTPPPVAQRGGPEIATAERVEFYNKKRLHGALNRMTRPNARPPTGPA